MKHSPPSRLNWTEVIKQCTNFCIKSGVMASVNLLAVHRHLPTRKGETEIIHMYINVRSIHSITCFSSVHESPYIHLDSIKPEEFMSPSTTDCKKPVRWNFAVPDLMASMTISFTLPRASIHDSWTFHLKEKRMTTLYNGRKVKKRKKPLVCFTLTSADCLKFELPQIPANVWLQLGIRLQDIH